MCHALVIEDQPIIANQMADLLREAGFASTSIAATEQEAIALALGRPPSLIVSDVQLVQGTGPGACRWIRRAIGKVPVVFVTATPQDCRQCDYALAVITKPASAGRILDALRQVIPATAPPTP